MYPILQYKSVIYIVFQVVCSITLGNVANSSTFVNETKIAWSPGTISQEKKNSFNEHRLNEVNVSTNDAPDLSDGNLLIKLDENMYRPLRRNELRSDKSQKYVTALQKKDRFSSRKTSRSITPVVHSVKVNTGETIKLKCRIPPGPYVVMWDKFGLDYPLSIGTQRFIPDSRIRVRYRAPDRWRLLISNARVNDTGTYKCTTSSGSQEQELAKEGEHARRSSAFEITGEVKEAEKQDNTPSVIYNVIVVDPLPSDRYQIDAPGKTNLQSKQKVITVTGPRVVFYGTPLELVCRASYTSAEAKTDPRISLEWYHQGVRRWPNPHRSGGVYITQRWLDSNLLENRLLIAWASEADAGQWICLDRSTLQTQPILSVKPNSHNFLTDIQQAKQLLAASIPGAGVIDYDRIEVDIVGLPDPTSYAVTSPRPSPVPDSDAKSPSFNQSQAPSISITPQKQQQLQSSRRIASTVAAAYRTGSKPERRVYHRWPRNSAHRSIDSGIVIYFVFTGLIFIHIFKQLLVSV